MQRERKVDVRPGRRQGSWVATVATAETQEKVEGSLEFSGPYRRRHWGVWVIRRMVI